VSITLRLATRLLAVGLRVFTVAMGYDGDVVVDHDRKATIGLLEYTARLTV